MKRNVLLSLLLCLAIIPIDSQAQITNYLKKQANRFVETAVDAADKKVTKKVDEKATEVGEKAVEGATKAIEREADKASQAISDAYAEGAESSAEASESAAGSLGSAFAALEKLGTVSLPHADTYNFKGQIVMETKVYDGPDDKEPGIMNMILWTGSGNKNIGVVNEFVSGDVEEENLNVITIADNENKCYVVLLAGTTPDEGGMGVISPIPAEEADNTTSSETSSSEASNLNKTGNTKTIAGIRCTEYSYIDDTSKSIVWIADQSKFSFSKNQLVKAGMGAYYSKGVEGFVMGYEGYLNDILIASMEITKIDDNATKSFSLANYMLIQGEE